MTNDTKTVIARLVAELRPVRRLASPPRRAGLWFAASLPYVACVVLWFSPRPDLAQKMAEWRYLLEQAAALATAVFAALSAFAMTVPGYSRRVFLIPLLPLALWIGILLEGCLRDVLVHGLAGLNLHADWICLPVIVATGAWPALVMLTMLRHGAPLTPHRTVAMGALASAGLGNVGLRLFHQQDVSLTVLLWQVGSTLALACLASWAGPRLLRWKTGLVRQVPSA